MLSLGVLRLSVLEVLKISIGTLSNDEGVAGDAENDVQ